MRECDCGCGSLAVDCIGSLPWPERSWPREARAEIERLRGDANSLAVEVWALVDGLMRSPHREDRILADGWLKLLKPFPRRALSDTKVGELTESSTERRER